MRPKILLLFEYGTLNGGELSLLAMLECLGREEFDFVAAAPETGRLIPRLQHLDVTTIPLNLRNTQGQKHSIDHINAHLIHLVKQVSPDLIHANSLAMGRMLGRIAPSLSIPCTAHLRDIIKLSKAAIADLNDNTALIAVSRATQQFHQQQGLHSDKVQVIHNGVDTDVFRPGQATSGLRRELGLKDSDMLVANIGQICLRKGQTLLAQAAASLADDFPEAHTLFVGERYSQKQESIDYENAIRETFHDVGIENRLHCLGFREDIPQLLTEIDLLVHTARQEPLGRVLLEATSCACPIIATDVGGTTEIVSHHSSALLIPPDNLGALTAAMRQMFKEPELRSRLGRQARQGTIKHFSLPAATERVHSFWKSLL
jgi:glycosyltransferase involved in cell wall biosynthesis